MFGSRLKTVNRVVMLPQEQIRSNPMQPRRSFDEAAIEELAASIAANGLLQPVTVRAMPEGGYELIAGERRLKACRRIGMDHIPAIVEACSDESAATLALIENLQRENLNCFEEAAALAQLLEIQNLSQSQLARQLGKSQPAIANKLRLLTLDEDIRQEILRCHLTERHARALLRLQNRKTQLAAVRVIAERGLNVGQTEAYISHLLEAPSKTPSRLLVVKDLRLFVNAINKAVSTMAEAGIEAESEKTEDEEYIHFSIRIPKKSVYRTRTTA